MPARLQRLLQRVRSASAANGSAGCHFAVRRGACHSDPDAAQHFAATRHRRYYHHKIPVDHRCTRCPARRRIAANGRASATNPDAEAPQLCTPTDWRRLPNQARSDHLTNTVAGESNPSRHPQIDQGFSQSQPATDQEIQLIQSSGTTLSIHRLTPPVSFLEFDLMILPFSMNQTGALLRRRYPG